MSPFFTYLLKVILCSAVLYGYYHLALRNRPFHQWNRFYLLAAVGFSLVFPLLTLPSFFRQPAQEAEGAFGYLWSNKGSLKNPNSPAENWTLLQVAGLAYSLIAAVLLLQFAAGIFQLQQLLRAAPKMKQKAFTLVLTAHEQAPFSFLHWVFWNKQSDPESGLHPAMLRHEQAHVQLRHSIDKLLMQTLLAFFWANPFFWVMRRELGMIHEFQADEAVLQQSDPKDLAALMLQAGFGPRFHTLVQPFFHQPIKRRLVMLHKSKRNTPLTKAVKLLSLPLFAFSLLAFAEKENVLPALIKTKQTGGALVAKDTTGLPASDSIKEVHVNKTATGSTITIVYKNGKKETLTAEAARKRGLLPVPPPPPPPPVPADESKGNKKAYANALVIIDGVEKGTMNDYPDNSFPVKPEDIKSMNVLKDKNAIDKYGNKGKNGVIEIETKKPGTSASSFFLNGWIPKQNEGC